jgi:hypothetical protein
MEERRWKEFSIDHKAATEVASPYLTALDALMLALLLLHSYLFCPYASFVLKRGVPPASSPDSGSDRYGLRLALQPPNPE